MAKRAGKSEDSSFHERVKAIIKRIPRGKVATYGQIATVAGNPRAARQVVRVLHACSRKDRLPWHRVINREGRISLKRDYGYELQKKLLDDEGVAFDEHGAVDLVRHQWSAPPIIGD
jgi:methylated-DNA-protein-cysteine methyltransferase-like protein